MLFVVHRNIMKKRDNVYGVRRKFLKWLLTDEVPFACSLGRYDEWLCDYYHIGDIILSIGLAPVGKTIDPIVLWSFDAVAGEAVRNLQIEEMDKALKDLRQEFAEKIVTLDKHRKRRT